MKEAVAFILDASPSMDLPCQDSTRMQCAKNATIAMISDLMLQSKQNEVCVVACKTIQTKHHLCPEDWDPIEEEPPYPNLTELTETETGVTVPTVSLLRAIEALQPTTPSSASKLRGDICDAIIVAADALYRRTAKRRYKRKIVLLTDAEHEVALDGQQIATVLDSLRSMECRLEVIGIDFTESVEFDTPAPPPSLPDTNKRFKGERGNDNSDGDGDGDEDDNQSTARNGIDEDDIHDDNDDEEEEPDDVIIYRTKNDRERLLRSLAEKTSGQIVAVTTFQQMINVNKGKRVIMSTRRKLNFQIAPGFSFEARFMPLTKKEGFPRTKTEAVIIDESSRKPLTNSLGEEMTEEIVTVVQYVDDQDQEEAVAEQDRTTAIRYGADLVPMSDYDYEGLKGPNVTGPALQILGYLPRLQVPRLYMTGPPYVFSGDTSQRACSAIAALAKALQQLDKVAICTFRKSNRGEPILGALLPYDEPYPDPIHLLLLRLPFAGEIKRLEKDNFDDILDSEHPENRTDCETQSQAADDLIDSLMLPKDTLASKNLPCPFLRSWNQTIVKRALDPTAPPVVSRASQGSESDSFCTPSEVLKTARPALHRFQQVFPLHVSKTVMESKSKSSRRNAGEGGGGRRKVLTYRDYLNE